VQRILEPGQIEALAQRSIARVRLPDRARLFAARAERLRSLAENHRTLGDYLRLMATVADAQHAALTHYEAAGPTPAQIEAAQTHGMPVVPATAWPRDARWREVLTQVCDAVVASSTAPQGARDTCIAVRQWSVEQVETQADRLLAGSNDGVEAAAAPFVMAALQVAWVALSSRLAATDVADLEAPGVCPVCGCLPVASIVHAESQAYGYRYLHCGLCATEVHRVRVTCTHCGSTKGITYESIEGAPEAVRAECCGECHGYRKIVYQEKDPAVEPVADDLASLALDLLLTEAGYHRASGNPLLWQPRA
jgi:FdhE protein